MKMCAKNTEHLTLSGLKMLLLLSCCIFAGIAAEDPAEVHYQPRNSSVCLHAGKVAGDPTVSWGIGEIFIVKGGVINPKYNGRVDYYPQNNTLCIKKLTVADNGVYQVEATKNFNRIAVKHILIVQETVPTPVMKTKALQSNRSTGFCEVTVNCSVQDEWAWSVCDQYGCETRQRSLSRVNITISSSNRTVVCHGNNSVSMGSFSESLDVICFTTPNTKDPRTTSTAFQTILVVLLILAFLCVPIVLAKMYYRSKQRSMQQAETATQVERLSAETPPQFASNEAPSCQGVFVYENLQNTATAPQERTAPDRPPKADSLYCVLQLPFAAGNCKREKRNDGRGHKKTATSEDEGKSWCNKVGGEAQSQPRSNMNGREELSHSVYATVQPVQTYPQQPENASPEETRKLSFDGDGDGDVSASSDAEAQQCHQEATGNSVTLKEAQHLVQTDTLYSVVQRPHCPPRPERPHKAREHHGGPGVDT